MTTFARRDGLAQSVRGGQNPSLHHEKAFSRAINRDRLRALWTVENGHIRGRPAAGCVGLKTWLDGGLCRSFLEAAVCMPALPALFNSY